MVRIDPAINQRLALKAVTTGERLNQIVARTQGRAGLLETNGGGCLRMMEQCRAVVSRLPGLTAED